MSVPLKASLLLRFRNKHSLLLISEYFGFQTISVVRFILGEISYVKKYNTDIVGHNT